MTKPDVLVVRDRPAWYFDRLAAEFTIHRVPNDDPANLDPEVASRIEVLTNYGAVGRRFIEALPRLKVIVNGGAGYEGVDLDAVRARGLVLTNVPGVTDGCVADMAFALLLSAARAVVRADRFVRAGRWPREAFPLVPRVHGRRLGILGMGRIGLAIARRGAGFDMPVAYHNRRRRDDVDHMFCPTLLELARVSDFLVVACPGGPETHRIVNAEVLEALGPKGIVVNIARGTIIDEPALIAALQTGRIMAAGLDVFEREPQVPAELIALENVVLAPHRAGGTEETWHESCELVMANIRAHFVGTPYPTPVAL